MCVHFPIDAPVRASFLEEEVVRGQEERVDNPICSACGSTMKRNGHTSSGATRWRCKGCGASLTHRIDNAAKRLAEFLDWLMGKGAQADLPGEGRTFRRRTLRSSGAYGPSPPIPVRSSTSCSWTDFGSDATRSCSWRAPKSMWSHGIWRRANVPRHGRPS